MIHLPSGTKVIANDRLVIRWKLPSGEILSQLKRVPHDCPMTADERRAYRKGLIYAVKAVRDNRQLGLRDSLDFVNAVRGTSNTFTALCAHSL